MTHTPGPWLIREGDEWTTDIVTAEGNNECGDVMYWNVASYNRQRDEAEANAYLIAAAPDLLEALESLINDSECSCTFESAASGHNLCAFCEAKTAIAKARGER